MKQIDGKYIASWWNQESLLVREIFFGIKLKILKIYKY